MRTKTRSRTELFLETGWSCEWEGTYVAFASSDIAERLAGSVAGTILPFSFNPELELVVDPSLLENEEIYFNAARLDRSMVLKMNDYIAVARPRLKRITHVHVK